MAHLKWLKKLDMKELYRETMEEYKVYYEEQTAKVGRFDERIKEITAQAKYREKVKQLVYFLGDQDAYGAVSGRGGRRV